ncbi:UNVERIFIED_CONTAM: hypothetical protein FKN15_029327 [Acipenser sinensis]
MSWCLAAYTKEKDCKGHVSDPNQHPTEGAVVRGQNTDNGNHVHGNTNTVICLKKMSSEKNPFAQLVSGVVWLCGKVVGTFDTFVNVVSARTAVGHDKEGWLILFHIDGQTGDRGGSNIWTEWIIYMCRTCYKYYVSFSCRSSIVATVCVAELIKNTAQLQTQEQRLCTKKRVTEPKVDHTVWIQVAGVTIPV